MANSALAIYPGSFDPITNGHVDLVTRTLRVFDKIIVAIATNPDKDHSLFSLQERIDMVNEVFAPLKGRVSADSFQGLLVDYAERKGSTVVIRGLRAISDFEYEFQLAGMNRKLMPEADTVFLPTSEKFTYISSSLVREIAALGGDISEFVHPRVKQVLLDRVSRRTTPAR